MVMAQAKHYDHEKIEALKVQYLTEELELTPEEAKNFWPLYEEYHKKERTIQQDRLRHFIDNEKLSNLKDSEIDDLITEEFTRQQKLLNLRTTYYEQFKKALGTRKAALYFNAEINFRKRLIRQLRERRKDQ